MLVLENSFVGGDGTGLVAVSVPSGTATIVYSTLGAGFGAGAAGLACIEGSAVSLRNSVVLTYGEDPEVECPNVEQTGNILEADVPPFDDQSNWFVDFSGGDYHLSGMHPVDINNAALWQTGDPLTDIDGDPRPDTDGSQDFAGADVLLP